MGVFHLKKYLPYYLDCVREDERQGARYFLTDEGKRFLVPPLAQEWSLTEKSVLTIQIEGDASAFLKSFRQQRGTGSLYYGYPLFVDWIAKSQRGWSGGFAIPVFLQQVEFQQSGSTLELRLVNDWPRINAEFLSSVLKTPEERRTFLHDIGLLETEGDPPEAGLAYFARKLSAIGIVDEGEPIVPESITTTPNISDIPSGGLYNRCVVVLGERSKFTAGLEYELEAIQRDGILDASNNTALRNLFGDAVAVGIPSKKAPVIEVVGLNDEQRAAVQSAFENPLTVVTGPPGTGKSQVVVTVLANAYLRGERVLFTSRNNKAVNVVEARINSFSDNPLVVRLGTKSGDRDLRGELIRFIAQVLSVSPTEEDRRAYAEAISTMQTLMQRRDELWKKVEQVREARNLVDRIDRALDGPRERLEASLCESLLAAEVDVSSSEPKAALEIVRKHTNASRSFFRGLALWLHHRKDADEVLQRTKGFRDKANLFGELPPQLSVRNDWAVWVAPLEQIVERLEVIEKAGNYRKAYASLKQLPSPDIFADELADLEERVWEWGNRLLSAYGRLLPDRLNTETKRSLGEFRATFERLSQDQIGGKAYAQLRREQERLFKAVSSVLPVWCVTNLSARGALPFEPNLFDLLIIDEASQCDIPSAIPLLFRAKRAMIIGDPQQLRHISSLEQQRSQLLESRHGLTSAADQPFTYVNNSLFDLATTRIGEAKVVTLREHFRSHANIIEFSNRTWYRNTLRICTDYRRLKKAPQGHLGVRWTQIDGAVQRPTSGGAICMEEVKAVVDELEDLLVHRKFIGTVGVVTPFRAQANRIRDLVTNRLDLAAIESSDLIVDTAHGFQGDERDVILFSPCVARNLPRGAKYFLSSTGNLFNVAITRARALLHVIGNQSACASCDVPWIEAFAGHVAAATNSAVQETQPNPWSSPSIGFWERPFFEALVKAGIKPIPQYRVHQYRLDFAIIQDGMMLDIEVDGEHYHRDLDGFRCREDVIRDWRLTTLGWKVKRFWVYEIRDDMPHCVREIQDTITRLRT